MHLGEILAKQAYNYCKQTVGVDDEFSGIVLGVLFDILTTQGKWRDASDLLEEYVLFDCDRNHTLILIIV